MTFMGPPRNLVTSLLEHEQIRTTLPKARDAARLAEKVFFDSRPCLNYLYKCSSGYHSRQKRWKVCRDQCKGVPSQCKPRPKTIRTACITILGEARWLYSDTQIRKSSR